MHALGVLLALFAAANACVDVRDSPGRWTTVANGSLRLDAPVDSGGVTFRWDCSSLQRNTLLRFDLVIETLRTIEPSEEDDGHGHSRGNLPRGTVFRRLTDRNLNVHRTRHIIVKAIAPTTCEYRTEELEINCEYSVFVVAVNNNEEPFACSNNQTFHTTARVVQHMVITTEILLSIGLVFLLWFCAMGAFLRQWKFVQLSTPYEATRHYKPQNVDQIRVVNREEDGIIFRHSLVNATRRTTSIGCTTSSEQLALRVCDESSKLSRAASAENAEAAPKNVEAGCSRVLAQKRSMPCVRVGLWEPCGGALNGGSAQDQPPGTCKAAELLRPLTQQQQSVEVLLKAKSAPNIFVTDLCTV